MPETPYLAVVIAGLDPISVKIAGKGRDWPFVSWSDLARPPTSCSAKSIKVVGGRHKAGHDTTQ
jgi:hypothetical protein